MASLQFRKPFMIRQEKSSKKIEINKKKEKNLEAKMIT
jgi:hypothetical protein